MPDIECQTEPILMFPYGLNGEVKIQISSLLALCEQTVKESNIPKKQCGKCKVFREYSKFRERVDGKLMSCCINCNDKKNEALRRAKLKKSQVKQDNDEAVSDDDETKEPAE